MRIKFKSDQPRLWNGVAAVTLSLVIAITLIASCGDTVGPEFDVSFEDANFEALIREVLDRPDGPITAEELSGITTLNGGSKNITNISGIEYCLNLTDLNLGQNNIIDITPLSGLTNLKGLNLSGNQINDLTPLSGLTNLTNLGMSSNKINDLAPLSGLKNIGWLFLGGNLINDITSLSELTNLKVLVLNVNKISNIKPLVDNTGFENGDFVELTTNPLSDTSINDYIPRLRAKGVDVRWEQN